MKLNVTDQKNLFAHEIVLAINCSLKESVTIF